MKEHIIQSFKKSALPITLIATTCIITSCESAPGKMSPVIYTKASLAPGATIKAEMLEVREIEERRIPVVAVREMQEITEKESLYPIEAGQICTVFDTDSSKTISFQLDKTTYERLRAAAKEAKLPINKLAKEYIFAELNKQ